MTGHIVRSVAAACLLVLSACAVTQPGEIITIAVEKELGAERTSAFVKARGGIYDGRAVEDYLQGLTDRLSAVAGVPEGYGALKVRVLDTNIPSAYTIAGGDIYLTRGIVAMANDEAQLAGVIAHEIGHVVARHVAAGIAANERLIGDIIRQKDISLRQAGTRSKQRSIIERELEGRQSEITSFSREAELEADRLAIAILRAAGYGTRGFGELLNRLNLWRQIRDRRLGVGKSRIAEIERRSGYPKTAERVAALGRLDARPADPVRQQRLMQVIDGLSADNRFFGGYVRQGVFWHPDYGFAFDVPASVFTDHGDFMHLVAARGLIGIRVDDANGASLDALTQQLEASKLRLRDPVKRTINGLPAIVVRATREDGEDAFSATITAVEVGERIVSFFLIGRVGESALLAPVYSEVVGSIRAIRPGDDPGPRVYRTRRVAEGDSVASLSDGAAFDGDGQGALRLLNGIGAGDSLPVSGWVKLVQGARPGL